MRTLNYPPWQHWGHTTLLGCLLLAIASPLTLTAQQENAEPEPPVEIRPAASDPTSQQLIRNFLTVVGGAEAYQQIENVVAHGTLEEAGKTKTFKLIEFKDGKRHLQLSWRHLGREHAEQFVFDGQQAWRQELSPVLKDPTAYSGQEGIHFSRQRWLLQPLVLPAVADYVFEYQGIGKVGRRTCYVVVGYGQNEERSWFYFDREKFLLLRWGGFGEVAGVREYMDYRASKFKPLDGVLLPTQIDLLVEDSAFGHIQFESILSNQEIDQQCFKQPESRTPVLRQRQKR